VSSATLFTTFSGRLLGITRADLRMFREENPWPMQRERCGGPGFLRLGQTVEQSPWDTRRRPHRGLLNGVSVRTTAFGNAQSRLYRRHDRKSYQHRSFHHGRAVARPSADERRRRSIEKIVVSSVQLPAGMHCCRYGDFHDGRVGLVVARGACGAYGRAALGMIRRSTASLPPPESR
jgi:hypothetical protein